jgi:hypothetical protein
MNRRAQLGILSAGAARATAGVGTSLWMPAYRTRKSSRGLIDGAR